MALEKEQQSFSSVLKLLAYLNLSPEQVNYHPPSEHLFKFRVPYSFVKRMKIADADDPLLLQVLPQYNESVDYHDFSLDPLAETHIIKKQTSSTPGILQKYQHRLLLMPTSACGIHCRYCFRRHFPYQKNKIDKDHLINQFQSIKTATDISEVILSGGDPLTLSDDRLEDILIELSQIKHIKRLRIHTRQLIIEPQRITTRLVQILEGNKLPIAVVFHCNHPNELSQEVAQQLKLIALPQVQLLNQSVLLKNINDNANVLAELSEKLYEFGILPYYLHQLDKVAGSQHFFVEDKKALEIYHQLQIQLPGYLVPKLVKDVTGSEYKLAVSS